MTIAITLSISPAGARASAGLMQKQLVEGSTVHALRSVRQYTLVSYSICMHTEV